MSLLLLLKSTPITAQPGLATLTVSAAGASLTATATGSATVTLNRIAQ